MVGSEQPGEVAGGGEALLGEKSQDGHGALAETCHEVVKLALGDTNHGSPPFTVWLVTGPASGSLAAGRCRCGRVAASLKG